MAIDLFCYTSHGKDDVERIINRLSTENSSLFSEKFIASKVRETTEMHREMATEYGLTARSMFLISVNDKGSANRVSEVATIVRNGMGQDRVVILLENEKLVP